jgi:hypothetical protein
MEEKIQLEHPTGKHAVRMEITKYELLYSAIKRCLEDGALTHKQLFTSVMSDFEKNSIKFAGSVEWYMEGVKLDMEAKNILERIKEGRSLKFRLKS